jgi:hypothetical protein
MFRVGEYSGAGPESNYKGRGLTIISAFQAVGQYSAHEIDEKELMEIERRACLGADSCGGIQPIRFHHFFRTEPRLMRSHLGRLRSLKTIRPSCTSRTRLIGWRAEELSSTTTLLAVW